MNKDIENDGFNFDIGGIFGDFEKLANPDGDTKEDEISEDLKKQVQDSLKDEEDADSEDSETDEEEVEVKETKSDSKDNSKDTKSKDPVEEDESDNEEDIEYSYKGIAAYLAEQGVIDFEDSDELEDTPELLEQAVFNTAKNMVEEYKESIPEEGKLFLDYLEKGGDPTKYLQTLEKPLDLFNLDLEDSNNQKKVVTEFLKTQEYSDEEITDMLQDYEDGLILEKQAKLASKKLEKIHSKRQEQLLAEQEAASIERQKAQDKYVSDIRTTINGSTTLGGLEVSAADKKEFEKYLLQKDKAGLTGYEKDLQENPMQTQIELAYLKFKKFNFDKLAKGVITKETKRMRNIIKTKDTSVKGNSGKVTKTDHSDLSGFSKMFG